MPGYCGYAEIKTLAQNAKVKRVKFSWMFYAQMFGEWDQTGQKTDDKEKIILKSIMFVYSVLNFSVLYFQWKCDVTTSQIYWKVHISCQWCRHNFKLQPTWEFIRYQSDLLSRNIWGVLMHNHFYRTSFAERTKINGCVNCGLVKFSDFLSFTIFRRSRACLLSATDRSSFGLLMR